MAKRITPFLMSEGRAEEAIDFYMSLFPDSGVDRIERYDAQGGEPGKVVRADFRLNGQRLIAIDSPVHHAFGFTPAVSLFVDCGSVEEIDRLFAALVEGGTVMMELGEYPFAARFCWLADRFGVSWQLSLA